MQPKKTDPTNPKDIIGQKKVALTAFPAVALAHASLAIMNGRVKYEPWNWRKAPVRASIYVDAAMRHILSWFECEEYAGDSNVHHLGHAIACLAILLDAQAHGKLVDDRPEGGCFADILTELNDFVKEKAAA